VVAYLVCVVRKSLQISNFELRMPNLEPGTEPPRHSTAEQQTKMMKGGDTNGEAEFNRR